MLHAPTTITLRRPSADADLVISRLESCRTFQTAAGDASDAAIVSVNRNFDESSYDNDDVRYSTCCLWNIPPTTCSSAPVSRRSSLRRPSGASQPGRDVTQACGPGSYCSSSYPSTPQEIRSPSVSPPRSGSSGRRRNRSGRNGGRPSVHLDQSGKSSLGSSGLELSPAAEGAVSLKSVLYNGLKLGRLGTRMRQVRRALKDGMGKLIGDREPVSNGWIVWDVSDRGRKVSVETCCTQDDVINAPHIRSNSFSRQLSGHHRHRQNDRRARSTNDLDVDLDIDAGENNRPMRRNLSTSMTLSDLRDGIFSAEFPLDALSPTADVRVRVTGNCMEMFVVSESLSAVHSETDDISDDGGGDENRKKKYSSRNESQLPRTRTGSCGSTAAQKVLKKKKKSADRSAEIKDKPLARYCGTVDLPIYVDAARLRFDVDDQGRRLLIQAPMKGYVGSGWNHVDVNSSTPPGATDISFASPTHCSTGRRKSAHASGSKPVKQPADCHSGRRVSDQPVWHQESNGRRSSGRSPTEESRYFPRNSDDRTIADVTADGHPPRQSFLLPPTGGLHATHSSAYSRSWPNLCC